MSEKKNWKVEVEEVVTKALKPVMEQLKTQNIPPSLPTEIEHKHFKDGDDICPECYPKVRKTVMEKEFKGADGICHDCKIPVKLSEAVEENWSCVNCGGKYAERKD